MPIEKNHLLSIDSVWIAISVDEDGNEGVCAYPMGEMGMMPLIAADKNRLADIIPLAKRIAATAQCQVKLIRLTTREEVETFDGRQ